MTCKKPIHICVGNLDKELEDLAKRLGKPKSQIVRDALMLYIEMSKKGRVVVV